ncbi:MAG: TatD family hydrolase [Oscillospiraceae bacterium]|nr:TatD family hydrolase [Oscillospiraceae bacterium]MCD8388607.1 TatD family hydrolase [Oscillospiraceae bacterium]
MYFDTHAHYDDARFDADRDAVLSAMPTHGVSLILNPGCTVESSQEAITLAARYPFVYAAVGIHPENCAEASDTDFAALRTLCAAEKAVAIGEIGLDYHWAENPPRAWQQQVFRRQLELAVELDLPVIVHDRDAHGDCLATVLDYPALRGVFHCFSGSAEMAAELLSRGWYLGFDGPVTYKNAKKALEVLSVTPPERILLETDSPYLPPVPHRGERNDSRYLPHIAAAVAAAKGFPDADTLAAAALENGKRLFGIA